MPLKRLIDNQKLRVDAHSRGVATPNDLKGVHIHKTFIDHKRRNKSIRIDITGDNIQYEKSFNDTDKARIVKEIGDVLETDKQKLIEFAKYVSDILWRWSNKGITADKAQEYAKKIASLFDLEETAQKEFTSKVDGEISRYISIHRDSQNKLYVIDQNAKRILISPGTVDFRKTVNHKTK